MLRASMAGEAIAARDAFLRIAEAKGLGPYELTAALLAGTGTNARVEEHLGGKAMALHIWDSYERAEVRLSEKEREFVADMLDWNKPTEKQLAWLKKLYQRTVREEGT